jgi:hypothetical protein
VQYLPDTLRILMTSGLLPAALIAIVLNLVLPEELAEADQRLGVHGEAAVAAGVDADGQRDQLLGLGIERAALGRRLGELGKAGGDLGDRRAQAAELRVGFVDIGGPVHHRRPWRRKCDRDHGPRREQPR